MRNKEDFFWGIPCRHGHKREDGTNLRYRKVCVMCERNAKLGKYDGMTQEQILEYLTNPRPPKYTEEEIRAKRVAASMRWTAKNKDKAAEYAKKYQSKPERREYVAARRREKYGSTRPRLTEEQRAARKLEEQQRAERRLFRQSAEYQAAQKAQHAERRRAYQRRRYAEMTPEQRQRLYDRRKELEAKRREDEHH